MELLTLVGGNVFAKKAVDSVKGGISSVRKNAGILYDDVKHCDAIGEMCRAKVNENIRFLAQGQGQNVSIQKPRKQRYGNVLIDVGGTFLTVGRCYGRDHHVKNSMFRDELTSNPQQMRLDLYGEGDTVNPPVDSLPSALILAWDIVVNNGIPSVTCIELQEVVGSPNWIKRRIDLLAMENNVLTISAPYIYDNSIDVKPKIKKRMSSNA